MEKVIVEPRNKKELQLISAYMKRRNIRSTVLQRVAKKKKIYKKKAKEDFLNSLEGRLNEVKLHMEGKIKLKDARDLLNEI